MGEYDDDYRPSYDERLQRAEAEATQLRKRLADAEREATDLREQFVARPFRSVAEAADGELANREQEIRAWIDGVRRATKECCGGQLSNPNAAPVMDLLVILDEARARLAIAEQRVALIDAQHEPLTPEEQAFGEKVADRIERYHADLELLARARAHPGMRGVLSELREMSGDLELCGEEMREAARMALELLSTGDAGTSDD